MTDEEFRRQYPRWAYDGKGGQKIIASPDELPEGWSFDAYPERSGAGEATDTHSTPPVKEVTALAKIQAEYGEISRDDLKSELTERGVKFAKNASTETLADLMLKELAHDDGAGDR
ncbi:MAG: hypothetical protein HC888_04665 [Candidatus Competibacteraceae bacterium]|nr:hypothetical protein [Candidatus Competibacteraceae bacterium]